MRTLLPLLLLLGAVAAPPAPAQDEVTIYRCTDAQGRLALQDFPCADQEQQQVRTMARPQDPEPPADPAPVAPAAPAPEPPMTEVIVRNPPRPIYECITPDGERYTSDDGDGNPRRAPAWGWGGPWPGVGRGTGTAPRRATDRRSAGIASRGMSTSPGPSLTAPSRSQARTPPPRPRPPGHRYPPAHAYGYGSDDGWIRDQCHVLPRGEACAVLRDQRSELRRRIFNAQPSERAVLREDVRRLSARLDEDCGIR